MDAYIISAGFSKFNPIFGIIFAVSTLLVSLFAYKVYKLTEQKQLKLFSAAFLFFSLAYIVQIILTFSIRYKLNELNRFFGMRGMGQFVTQPFAVIFSVGLVLLTYMTLKSKDKRILFLLLGLVIIPLITASRVLYVYHLIASFLLLLIILFYYKNYTKHKKLSTGLVLVAFILLLFGNIQFIFSLRHGLFFMLGRILEFIAYMIILLNLKIVSKK